MGRERRSTGDACLERADAVSCDKDRDRGGRVGQTDSGGGAKPLSRLGAENGATPN